MLLLPTRMIASLLVTGLLLFSTTVPARQSADEATTNEQPAAEPAQAEAEQIEPRVYVKRVKKPLTEVYSKVFTAMENGGYFVLFEPNIGKNLEHFAQRWGDDYNRNNIEQIRSMVFCNAWYANQISNIDSDMLALCPLHLTLTHKDGMTTILFVRPSQVANDSPARKIATELENDVINTIERIVFY